MKDTNNLIAINFFQEPQILAGDFFFFFKVAFKLDLKGLCDVNGQHTCWALFTVSVRY